MLLPCELLTGSDLVLLGLQSPEAALAVHRDAELADVGEQLHDLRVSGAEGDHWSLCCQRGGNVVKTLITVNRRDSQRERERNRSVEVTAPSLIPCPAGRLQCVTGDTSLVKL